MAAYEPATWGKILKDTSKACQEDALTFKRAVEIETRKELLRRKDAEPVRGVKFSGFDPEPYVGRTDEQIHSDALKRSQELQAWRATRESEVRRKAKTLRDHLTRLLLAVEDVDSAMSRNDGSLHAKAAKLSTYAADAAQADLLGIAQSITANIGLLSKAEAGCVNAVESGVRTIQRGE